VIAAGFLLDFDEELDHVVVYGGKVVDEGIAVETVTTERGQKIGEFRV
jgi:hypothetical protein